MTAKALVFLAAGFEEIEAVTVIDVLRRAGVEVTVAGIDAVNVTGSRGVTVVTDKILSGTEEDFDAAILPGGGNGAKNLAASEKVNEMIKAMNAGGKIIAAICAAPAVVLAPVGLLDNKFATCYPGMEQAFNHYTTFKEDPVVIDGNIITSRGPGTAIPFALAIVKELSGEEVSQKVRKATLSG